MLVSSCKGKLDVSFIKDVNKFSRVKFTFYTKFKTRLKHNRCRRNQHSSHCKERFELIETEFLCSPCQSGVHWWILIAFVQQDARACSASQSVSLLKYDCFSMLSTLCLQSAVSSLQAIRVCSTSNIIRPADLIVWAWRATAVSSVLESLCETFKVTLLRKPCVKVAVPM